MAVEVETKDCTALTDGEIAEMADLCAEGPCPYEVGFLSKQTEEWVLVSTARVGGKLKGFSFFTLERIGGTPAIIVGLGSIGRHSKRDTILRAMITDQMRRAVLAFPDEDVVIGAQLRDAAGFEAYKSLHDIVPRPGYKATGEDRAWGRRFARRFDIEPGNYDERGFTVTGDGGLPRAFDHESTKPEETDPAVVGLFDDLDTDRGDTIVGFGWALAEDLMKLGD